MSGGLLLRVTRKSMGSKESEENAARGLDTEYVVDRELTRSVQQRRCNFLFCTFLLEPSNTLQIFDEEKPG